MLDSCLSHNRSNQVVCENVSPDLFPDQIWSLVSQLFHLHRRLDATQIQFVVPSLEIRFRKIFFGCLAWIKNGRYDNNGFRAKARLLNFDSNLSDRKGIGQLVVGCRVSIHASHAGRDIALIRVAALDRHVSIHASHAGRDVIGLGKLSWS